jgi:hypothetical protein
VTQIDPKLPDGAYFRTCRSRAVICRSRKIFCDCRSCPRYWRERAVRPCYDTGSRKKIFSCCLLNPHFLMRTGRGQKKIYSQETFAHRLFFTARFYKVAPSNYTPISVSKWVIREHGAKNDFIEVRCLLNPPLF